MNGSSSRGDDICLAIERGLETSRTLVLCLFPAAPGSDWVGLERRSIGRGNLPIRDPANAGRRFIPLLLADCPPLTMRGNCNDQPLNFEIWSSQVKFSGGQLKLEVFGELRVKGVEAYRQSRALLQAPILRKEQSWSQHPLIDPRIQQRGLQSGFRQPVALAPATPCGE